MAEPKKKKPSAPAASSVISEPTLFEGLAQICGNLTPRLISSVLAQADMGHQYQLVDLTHDCRQKDGTLHAALTLSELAVSQLKFQVIPPPKASAKEKKLAEAFCEAFSAAENRSTFVEHTVGERKLFGHATTEALWGDFGKYLAPVKYKPIHCRRFGFRKSDGALTFTNVAGRNPDLGIELLEEFAPGNFIQSRQRVNGDVPAREGLAQMIVWLSVGRNWGYRDWMQLAEIAWKPKRLGKYKRGANPEDVNALKRILRDIMTNGAAVHSEDVELNLIWPQGAATGSSSKSVHRELLVWLGAELTKAILGSADQLEPGENGARAAVETRADNPKTIRDTNARSLAEAITRQQLVPFTRYNGGERVRPGTFEFITDDPTDLEKFSKALLNFKSASVRIGENWVSETANIPIPSKGERVLGEDDEQQDDSKPGTDKPEDDGDEADA